MCSWMSRMSCGSSYHMTDRCSRPHEVPKIPEEPHRVEHHRPLGLVVLLYELSAQSSGNRSGWSASSRSRTASQSRRFLTGNSTNCGMDEPTLLSRLVTPPPSRMTRRALVLLNDARLERRTEPPGRLRYPPSLDAEELLDLRHEVRQSLSLPDLDILLPVPVVPKRHAVDLLESHDALEALALVHCLGASSVGVTSSNVPGLPSSITFASSFQWYSQTRGGIFTPSFTSLTSASTEKPPFGHTM